MYVSVSVMITSYNQVQSLRFLLSSLEQQVYRDFEVIVADDGSSDGSAELCRQNWNFPLHWVTQKDEGYRKSKILNQALRSAQADYLIFIDGDVILEKHFIQDHLQLRKPNHFVCGRRVDLGPKLTSQITEKEARNCRFGILNGKLLWSALSGDTIAVKRALRLTHPWVRRIMGYHRPLDLLGSNFSVWKSDLIAVNGFNESLESYWGEDGDLFIRLRNSGKTPIGAKSLCIQFHLFHKRRTPTEENVKKYEELLKDLDYRWAKKGYE